MNQTGPIAQGGTGTGLLAENATVTGSRSNVEDRPFAQEPTIRNVDRSLPIALLIAVIAMAAQAHAFSTGIASTSFGASGCNQCHSGGSTPTVTLTGPTGLVAGSTAAYTLQITAIGSQNEGGLNVRATDGTLAVGGSDSANTQTIAGAGGFAEITHTGPKTQSSGFVTFSFLWTAPSTPGNVTMTGWGNAVNGDFHRTGDAAAMATLVVGVTAGSPTPTPPPGCATTPLSGCRTPIASEKSKFIVKSNSDASKDGVTWSWTKGAASSLADFGDPANGSTSYHLCVYDESAGVPAAVMAMTVPPGGTCGGNPCWAAKKTGFLYKDKSLTNDGIMLVKLKSGADGKAKVLVKGKGGNVPVPTPVGPGLFAQDTAVIVQLVNSDGTCWEADFSAPATGNDSKGFKDMSD
jgi:hypothetical protein